MNLRLLIHIGPILQIQSYFEWTAAVTIWNDSSMYCIDQAINGFIIILSIIWSSMMILVTRGKSV